MYEELVLLPGALISIASGCIVIAEYAANSASESQSLILGLCTFTGGVVMAVDFGNLIYYNK